MTKRFSPLLRLGRLDETNPFGFNWRSSQYPGSGDLGNGRVVRPDPAQAASDWKKAGGKGQADWTEFAKRAGLFPGDIPKGWASLDAPKKPEPAPEKKAPASPKKPDFSPTDDVRDRIRFGEAIKLLSSVLGESGWWGYSAPNFGKVPGMSTAAPNPGFGFHTKSAEEIWKQAKIIADENPKETTQAIIGKAIDKANSLLTELTPEDIKMLEMAVNWYLSGKAAGMEEPYPPYGGNKTSGARADTKVP